VELLVRDGSGAPVLGTLSVEYGSPAASELQQLWVTGGFGGTYSVQLPAGPTQLHLRSGLAPAPWPGVRRELVVGYDREALPVQLPVPASLRIAAPGGGGEAGFWVELTPEHAPTRRFATTGPHLSVTALPPGRWDVRRGLAGAAASTFQALEVAPGQILELP
jgi:hypothetical protein